MAQQTIGIGAAANDGTGDPLRSAFSKANDNFTELYGGAGTDLTGALLAADNLSDVASAGTARTNLGATTVGGNIFTLANPSAVTFLRVNADNSVSPLSAPSFRTAIGAGTGTGDLVSTNNLGDLTNAGTARTNLGATTVGGNIFALANPGAITFLRVNADNSVSALSASAFRTAIGAGTGTGDLVSTNNLSDVASASTSRTNLGAAAHDPSIQSVTSSATVTPTFADDQVNITAQAAGLTLANPTGTAVPAWGIVIRIKDNGTARAISFGTQYRAMGVTLPTTTVISKTLYLAMIYNSTDTKWDVVAVAQEA